MRPANRDISTASRAAVGAPCGAGRSLSSTAAAARPGSSSAFLRAPGSIPQQLPLAPGRL